MFMTRWVIFIVREVEVKYLRSHRPGIDNGSFCFLPDFVCKPTGRKCEKVNKSSKSFRKSFSLAFLASDLKFVYYAFGEKSFI